MEKLEEHGYIGFRRDSISRNSQQWQFMLGEQQALAKVAGLLAIASGKISR